jgi:chromosome segregation ATPase
MKSTKKKTKKAIKLTGTALLKIQLQRADEVIKAYAEQIKELQISNRELHAKRISSYNEKNELNDKYTNLCHKKDKYEYENEKLKAIIAQQNIDLARLGGYVERISQQDRAIFIEINKPRTKEDIDVLHLCPFTTTSDVYFNSSSIVEERMPAKTQRN